eukprot:403370593
MKQTYQITLSQCQVSCNITEAYQPGKCKLYSRIDFDANEKISSGNLSLGYPYHETLLQTENDIIMDYDVATQKLIVIEYQEEALVFYQNETLSLDDFDFVLVNLKYFTLRNPQTGTRISSYFNFNIGSQSVRCERKQLITEANISISVSSQVLSVPPRSEEILQSLQIVYYNRVPINTKNLQFVLSIQPYTHTGTLQNMSVLIKDKDGVFTAQSATINNTGQLVIVPSKNYSAYQEIMIQANNISLYKMAERLELTVESREFQYGSQKSFVYAQVVQNKYEILSLNDTQIKLESHNKDADIWEIFIAKPVCVIPTIIILLVIVAILFLKLTSPGKRITASIARKICRKKMPQRDQDQKGNLESDKLPQNEQLKKEESPQTKVINCKFNILKTLYSQKVSRQ